MTAMKNGSFFERCKNLMDSAIHHLCPAGAGEMTGKM